MDSTYLSVDVFYPLHPACLCRQQLDLVPSCESSLPSAHYWRWKIKQGGRSINSFCQCAQFIGHESKSYVGVLNLTLEAAA